MHRSASALVPFLLLAPALQGLRAQAPLAGRVLVANQQAASATLVDLATGKSSHIQVGNGPHETTISPDGRIGIVTVYGAQVPGNGVAVVDMATGTVTRTIDLGRFTRPHGATFLPGSNTMLAVTSESTSRVVLVDLAKGEVVADVPTQAGGSHMLGVTADGKRIYTANVGTGSVSELDVTGRAFTRQLPIAPRSEGVAVRPDGAEVWVGSNTNGTVSVVDTKTWAIAATLTGFTMPYRIGISPDNKLAVVVDPERDGIHVVDVATRKTLGTVIGLGSPRGVAIAADNRTAFITSAGRSSVIAVDLVTRKTLGEFAVQTAPDGVAWTSGAAAPR